MVHGILSHCQTGEEIMAVGSILRHLEAWNDRHPPQSDAYIVVYGRHPERDDLTNTVTAEVFEGVLVLGYGEHFSPGPAKDNLHINQQKVSLWPGEEIDLHFLDDWVTKTQEVLEQVERVDGSF
ncbi:hypothetical protein OEW28_17375 [Defluviimonas sp. WL0002]|uniref:Uncharacterized protein n=2 Tax=Albidovulum marisflavi TaxID=2984159 RepID=A0ABT2ZGW8_9RHOB|nr:hypothetical protein [Defluviimonas sp. WL0002]